MVFASQTSYQYLTTTIPSHLNTNTDIIRILERHIRTYPKTFGKRKTNAIAKPDKSTSNSKYDQNF